MSVDVDRRELRAALCAVDDAELVPAEGQVLSPRAFVQQMRGRLAVHEYALIDEHASCLEAHIPPPVRSPWKLASPTTATPQPMRLKFVVDGARSAHLPEHGLQLKACRPVDDARLHFIGEDVDTTTGELIFSRLPFGVLRAEGVLRELLAYVFCVVEQMPVVRRPVAVFRYAGQGERYALVLRSPHLLRAEATLHYPARSLDDLLATAVAEHMFGEALLGAHEVDVNGCGRDEYARRKANCLARWHLAGGFRGILNSNIGNEVRVGEEIALTDFDSFRLMRPPMRPSQEQADAFVLLSFLEACRSSLPIAALVLPDRSAARAYLEQSLCFARYRAALAAGVEALGWASPMFERAAARAVATRAFAQVAADQLVCWQHLVASYTPQESLYIAHSSPNL